MAEHHFHTPLPLELQASIPAGDIEVETVDGDERLVEQTQVTHDGNRLVIAFQGKKPFGITISIGDFSFGSRQLSVRVRVPHGTTAVFQTASGDMKAAGRLGEVDVKTASGDFRLRGEIERDAVIKTVSGDAQLDRVGGDLKAQTVSGDVHAGWIGGSVEAKSVSGDVRFDSVREGSASFTSVSGDIEIGIASGSFLDVDAGSVSGDLSSDVPLSHEPGGDGGVGPTVVLRGKTVSGDVKVFRAA